MDDQALYLEADEDITSAIDKLRKAPEGPVQIVVPKRSTLLQSVINLKLLKKAADDSGRELVLVTNDKVATDLAGRVGLAVASSVGAKAVLPEVAEAAEAPAAEEVIEDDTPAPEAPPVSPAAANKRPDAMRKAAPVVTRRPIKDEEPVEDAAALVAGTEAATEVAKPAKTPKVPNYGRFNKRLVWGGVVAALIVAYIAGMYFFSSAKVTLYAAASQVTVNTDFAVDPNATNYDDKTNILPGQTLSGSKQVSSDFQATGSKDEGTKAGGTMTVYNASDSNPHMLVAGTRFQAPDGKIFRSNSDVTVPGAGVKGGKIAAGTAQVQVTADQNGDSYNEGPAQYSIPALGDNSMYGQGGQMSGGTSKVVKVVQQSDIDTAQKAALDKAKDDELKDLKDKAKSGQYVVADSFSQSAANATSSPNVGEEATSATLNLTINYSVLAVNKDILGKFIELQAKEQIGDNNQIYDNGLGTAQVSADGKNAAGQAQFKINSSAYGGVKIDTDALAKQLSGKRYGEAVDMASKVAGVSRAEVSLWPAWATGVPHVASRVKVSVSVAAAKPNQ
jgi:hypothetical protein